ncbi:MAG: hypothetical protein CL927_08615 [Deltaproteobacteria bacterium]|nr:hypothetical protein [Deltaproteobacteria bacterium]HCH64792.1 hypothetical protein [Deltaproteobacteria bacterium]
MEWDAQRSVLLRSSAPRSIHAFPLLLGPQSSSRHPCDPDGRPVPCGFAGAQDCGSDGFASGLAGAGTSWLVGSGVSSRDARPPMNAWARAM